jgi:hypothetical protein
VLNIERLKRESLCAVPLRAPRKRSSQTYADI